MAIWLKTGMNIQNLYTCLSSVDQINQFNYEIKIVTIALYVYMLILGRL